MPKEKSINPAQAQRKAEKAKAIKKGLSQPLFVLSSTNLFLQAKRKLPLDATKSSPAGTQTVFKSNSMN
jgi:hypothetical protein